MPRSACSRLGRCFHADDAVRACPRQPPRRCELLRRASAAGTDLKQPAARGRRIYMPSSLVRFQFRQCCRAWEPTQRSLEGDLQHAASLGVPWSISRQRCESIGTGSWVKTDIVIYVAMPRPPTGLGDKAIRGSGLVAWTLCHFHLDKPVELLHPVCCHWNYHFM